MLKRKKEIRARRRIATGGIRPGCGVSFTCAALACGLKAAGRKDVTVMELGNPYFYAALELDSRPLSGPFESFCERLRSKKSVSGIRNTVSGINWLARRPGEDTLSDAETVRAVSSVPEGDSLLDCSGMDGRLLWEVYASSDVRILVIDPLPSVLCGAYDVIGRFRLDFPDGILLVNRMNAGVHEAELKAFLGTSSYRVLPLLPGEYIYRAEYSCSPFFEQKKAARLIEQPARDIAESF